MRYLAACLLSLLLLPGCSTDDSVTEPDTGAIRVTLTTNGEDIATSYSVVVDGMIDRTVNANGNVTFTTLAPGDHEVLLGAVPANCTVSGANPRPAEVVAGETAQIAFGVECVSDKPEEPEEPEGPPPPL